MVAHICAVCEQIAKALVVCLESKDYVQIRNALIVLNEIITHFPLISVLILTSIFSIYTYLYFFMGRNVG
jgi:hypothetical protein